MSLVPTRNWTENRTYNPPRAKTNMSALFCIRGNLLAQIGCIGNTNINTSVEIEKPALANQFLVKSIQVGLMDLSQAPSIGLHCQMDEATVATM